jgi:hypothetical protein
LPRPTAMPGISLMDTHGQVPRALHGRRRAGTGKSRGCRGGGQESVHARGPRRGGIAPVPGHERARVRRRRGRLGAAAHGRGLLADAAGDSPLPAPDRQHRAHAHRRDLALPHRRAQALLRLPAQI